MCLLRWCGCEMEMQEREEEEAMVEWKQLFEEDDALVEKVGVVCHEQRGI